MEKMLKYIVPACLIFLYTNNILAQQPSKITAIAIEIYQAGNSEEAIRLLQQAISIDPNFLDATLILGQIYLETNQPKSAKNILLKSLEIIKDNPEVHYALGVAYFNMQNFDSAVVQCKIVLKLDPKSKAALELISLSYLNLGVMAYQDNKKNKAIEKFRQAIESNEQNIQAFKNLAVTTYELGNKEEAERFIKRGLKIETKDKILLKILIQIYVDANKLQEALEPAEKYYKSYPRDVDGALQLAYLYRFNNQGDRAFDIYEELLKQFPDEQRIYDDYSELYKYKGKFDEAVSIYMKSLNHLNDKTLIYEKVAEIYIEAKRYEDARKAYRNALVSSRDSARVYHKIALTYITEKNKWEAIQILQVGLKSSPNNWDLYRELGKVLEDSSSYNAIQNYEFMLKLRPDDPFPYIRLGVIYNNIDSTKVASENCQKAIDLGTELPLPYHILAEIQKEKLDTASFQKNEVLSISKSLKIIAQLKSDYLGKFSKGIGKLDYTKIEKMKTDSEIILEFTQNLLKQGLENLLQVNKPTYLENEIIQWRKDYSQNPLLLEYLGKIYEEENKIDNALSVYKELIKFHPQEKEGHIGMGRILTLKGDLRSAILAYKRALTIDSQDEIIYENLIYLSRATETTNELINSWSLLEKREPENNILLSNFAKILRIENKTDELKRVEKKLEQIVSNEKNRE